MCKRMIIRTSFYIVVLIIIIAACAKISAPSGGPRDKTPPVVVKSSPLNAYEKFQGQQN